MSWKDLLPALAAMPLLALVAGLLFTVCARWLRRGIEVVEDAKRVIEPRGHQIDDGRRLLPAGSVETQPGTRCMDYFESLVRGPLAVRPAIPFGQPPVIPGRENGEG